MSADKIAPRILLIQDLGPDSPAYRVLSWMEAPDNLLSLDHAIENLIAVHAYLLDAIRIVDGGIEDIDLETPDYLLEGLSQLQKYLIARRGDAAFRKAFYLNNSAERPFHGIIGTHPLYALIGEPCPGNEEFGLRHKSLGVAIAKALRERATDRRPYTSTIRDACDAMRHIIHGGLIGLLPQLPSSEEIVGYHGRILARIDSARSGNINNYLTNFARAVRFLAYNQGGHQQANRVVREDREQLEDDAPHTIHIQRVISSRNLSSHARNLARQSGLTEEELVDDEEFVCAEYHDKKRMPSLAQQVITRQNVIANLEKIAQQLPGKWDVLASGEVRAFLEGLRSLAAASKGTVSTDDQTIQEKALLMLTLMFWTGRSREMLLHLRAFEEERDLPPTMGASSVAFVLSSGMLYTPALRPKASPKYRNVDFSLGLRSTDKICLPLARYIQDWLHLFPRPDHSSKSFGVAVFAGNSDKLFQELQPTLKRIVGAANPRVTERRLERYLFWHIISANGDIVQASLITGRPDRLADTGLHYFAVDIGALAETYCQSADQIMRDAQGLTLPVYDFAEVPAGWCGSPIAPRPMTVRNVAAELRRSFREAAHSVLTVDYRIGLHNALAHYVHTMLRFATGMRNVGRILPSWDRINVERQLMFISDKDDVAGFHSRVVPIPDVLIEQLDCWRHHVNRVCATLDIHSLGKKTTGEQIRQPIFYLRRTHKILTVLDSRHLTDSMPDFGLPENCNRHYLRTELIRRGCNVEHVNHFMGHWARGRQPLDRFGCGVGQDYFDSIRPHLAEILKEAGFFVVEGFA